MGGDIRVLYLADYEGHGLDPRLTRCAIRLADVCHVVLGTWGGEVEAGLRVAVAGRGLRVHEFRSAFHPAKRPMEILRSIQECRRVLDSERIDVVHCQCYRHLVLCRIASTLSRRKAALVFTDHNSDGRRGLRVVLRLGVLAMTMPRIIDMDNYVSKVPFLRKRATWISNPVETAVFRAVERPREFSDPISLVFPARLTGSKGHDDLLKICSRLRHRDLRFKLVLAGDGPARQHLESVANTLNLGDAVHFAGQLSRDSLIRALWAADIGVFPSPLEMLPCAVLEMMATGLPVVAFGAGGIPCIIRHCQNGFVAPVGATEEFEEHLARLMTAPCLARQIGRQAATDVRSHFDVAVITREIAQLYRTCA